MSTEASKSQSFAQGGALVCLMGGLFATLLVAVPRTWLLTDRFTYPKGVIFHVAALTTGVACLAWLRRWRLDVVDLLVGVFAGLGVLSALTVAHNPWLALGAVGVTLSGGVLFLCARALAEAGRREAMLLALVMAAGLLALSVLLEAYGPLEGLSTWKRAPGGTLGHRNRAAHLLVLALPVAWLCLVRARERRVLGALLACVLVLGAAVTLSRSRAAWLGGFVVALEMGGVWLLKRHSTRGEQWRTVSFVAALLVGVGVALIAPNALEWRDSYLDTLRRIGEHEAGSGQGRLIQYANTLRMVADTPLLGVGPGNWMVHYPRYATPGDPSYSVDALLPVDPLPQSDWIGLLAERGVPALLVLAAIAALLLGEYWKRVRKEVRPELWAEALALMAVMTVLIVVGGLDTVLLTPTATFFVAVAVGALAHSHPERVVLVPSRTRRRAAMVGVALLTGVPLLYGMVTGWAHQLLYIRPQTSERFELAVRLDPGGYEARVFMGMMKARSGQCEQALTLLREAKHLMPYAEAPLRLGARCRQKMRDPMQETTLPSGITSGL